MQITYKRSRTIHGKYAVFINGRAAGQVCRWDIETGTWWRYRCGAEEGQPVIDQVERRREWAVRHGVLRLLEEASKVTDYFAL